jgi:hypothetical protein
MASMKIRAAACKALENAHGRITAKILVDAARSKTHPLHNDFDWNDKTAAHEHRLDVARGILASVRLIITRGKLQIPCVAYVRDPDAASDKQGYVNTTQLCTEAETAEKTIFAEIAHIQSRLERARELAFGLDLEDEFDAAIKTMLTLKSRLRRGLANNNEVRASV